MTANDVIKSSLRLLGVLASGETPSAEEAADALSRLNSMIKSWNIDGLLVYQTTREELALGASAQTKTIGATGDLVTTRPTRITSLGVKNGNVEIPIEIISANEYAGIVNKSVSSNYPLKVWIQGSYPNDTLYFWPIPTSGLTLCVQSLKPIASALLPSDTITLPDGYEEALQYNLAVRLAPEFGRSVDPMVYQIALDLKASLARQNSQEVLAVSDPTNSGMSEQIRFLIGE